MTASYRFTVSRAGIATLPDDGCRPCAGYDLAYGPHPTGLIGGSYADILNLSDPDQPPIVSGLRFVGLAGNVDSDGTIDLFAGPVTANKLVLMRDPPLVVDFPAAAHAQYGSLVGCTPVDDMDGDGHAELVSSDFDGPGTYLQLYPGGPDGYLDQPLWTLPADDRIGKAIALQADDDPDLELLAMLGYEEFPLDFGFDLLALVLIDKAHTANPITTTIPASGFIEDNDTLHNLGDLDGDGRDEVLLPIPRATTGWTSNMPDVDLMVLTSTNGYDATQPALSLALQHPTGDDDTYELQILVVDVDQDGHLDIVATQSDTESMIQVWFGPILEPPHDTGHTGHTADTATPTEPGPTADTSPPTGPTGTVDTGGASTTASTPAAPGGDSRRCGCAQPGGPAGAGLALLLAVLARRRRRAPPGSLEHGGSR